MQWLAAICVRRPVFATVLMLLLSVVGAFGYLKLGVDRFPKIDFPVVLIVTTLPGAAPEEVETELTDKIEAAVNTISGIDELRSASSEGVSQVIVTFVLDKDVDVAAQEVRDRGAAVLRDLPGKTIMLGVIDLGTPDVETPEQVAARIRAGLAVLPAERLVPAPDCGMKYLPREAAFGKLQAMVAGAQIVRSPLERERAQGAEPATSQ